MEYLRKIYINIPDLLLPRYKLQHYLCIHSSKINIRNTVTVNICNFANIILDKEEKLMIGFHVDELRQ